MDAPALDALFAHLDRVPEGPQPSGAWRRRCRALLGATPEAEAEVRELLRRAAAVAPEGPRDVRRARGAVWAAAGADAPWATARIAAVAAATMGPDDEAPSCLPLANAAVRALGATGGPGAVAHLRRLRARATHATVRAQIDRALGSLGAVGADEDVPTHGLGRDGTLTLPVGAGRARIVVGAGGVRLRWEGVDARTAPASTLADLRRRRRRIAATLAAERRRLAELAESDHAWDFQAWLARYVEHPITGVVAATLPWRIDGRLVRVDREAGRFVDTAGGHVVPALDAVVRPGGAAVGPG